MKKGMILRKANFVDVESIVELCKNNFEDQIVNKTIYGYAGVDSFIKQRLLDKNSYYFILANDDNVIGFIEFRLLTDSLFLNYIVVDRSFQGLGLASKLYYEALGKLKSICVFKEVILDVFKHNVKARAWYEKLGFIEFSQQKWLLINHIHSSSPIVHFKELCAIKSEENFRKYGFCNHDFKRFDKFYCVGRLGSKYIRIVDVEILNNLDFLRFLIYRFPDYKLLAICPDSFKISDLISYDLFLSSIRMIKKNNYADR